MFENIERLLIESLSFDELSLSLFLIARLCNDQRYELLCYPGASDLRAIEIFADVVRALLAFAIRRILQRFH